MSFSRGVKLAGFARRHLGRMASGRRAVEPYSWAEAGKLLRDLVLSVAVESSAERPSRS